MDFVRGFDTRGITPTERTSAFYKATLRSRYTRVMRIALEFLESVNIGPAIILFDNAEIHNVIEDFPLVVLPLTHFSRDLWKFLFGANFVTLLPAQHQMQEHFFVNFLGEILYDAANSIPTLKLLLDHNNVNLFNLEKRGGIRFKAEIFSEANEKALLAAVKSRIPTSHPFTWTGFTTGDKTPGMLFIIRKFIRLMRTIWKRRDLITDQELQQNTIALRKCFEDVSAILKGTLINFDSERDDNGKLLIGRGSLSQNISDQFYRTLKVYQMSSGSL